MSSVKLFFLLLERTDVTGRAKTKKDQRSLRLVGAWPRSRPCVWVVSRYVFSWSSRQKDAFAALSYW
jgi:hypothetical protein